jgi:hypothetical protein
MWSVVFVARRPARTWRRVCRQRICVVLPAVHAEPDHRVLFLRTGQIELDITVEQAMTLICRPAAAQPNNGDVQKSLPP